MPPVTQDRQESWQEWKFNLLIREREWEKRKARNLTTLINGILPYAAIVIVGATLWCLAH